MAKHHKVDILIMTVVNVEFEAVANYLTNTKTRRDNNNSRYHIGEAMGYTIALRQIPHQGNDSMASDLPSAIQFTCPRYVFLVGIAGGRKKVKVGDVVFANKIYNYELGVETSEGFKVRPLNGLISHQLMELARFESKNNDWQQLLNQPVTQSEVKVGAIASGNKLLKVNEGRIEQLLDNSYEDTLAVEMEGSGFFIAAHRYSKELDVAIIRGISDTRADKDDDGMRKFRVVAAENAAAFTFHLIRKLREEEEEDNGYMKQHTKTKYAPLKIYPPSVDIQNPLLYTSELLQIKQWLLGKSKSCIGITSKNDSAKTIFLRQVVATVKHQFANIIWLSVADNQSIEEAINDNLQLLKAMKAIGYRHFDRLGIILDELNVRTEKSLLVIDGINMMDMATELDKLLPLPPNWTILYTTSFSFENSVYLELPPPTFQQIQQFFYHFYRIEKNNTLVEQLYHLLDKNLDELRQIAINGQQEKMPLNDLVASLQPSSLSNSASIPKQIQIAEELIGAEQIKDFFIYVLITEANFFNPKRKDLLQSSGYFQDLNEREQLGLISDDFRKQERNRLRYQLLNIVDNLK